MRMFPYLDSYNVTGRSIDVMWRILLLEKLRITTKRMYSVTPVGGRTVSNYRPSSSDELRNLLYAD
jgi:hypothetical protein